MSAYLTRTDARIEAERLQKAGYRPPDQGALAAANIWAEVLEDIAPADFRAAVTRWMLEGSAYWPVPSQLRSLAIDIRRARIEAESRSSAANPHDPLEPCPVCGAVLRELQPEEYGGAMPRFGVLHDAEKHRQAGIPWVGYPSHGHTIGPHLGPSRLSIGQA